MVCAENDPSPDQSDAGLRLTLLTFQLSLSTGQDGSNNEKVQLPRSLRSLVLRMTRASSFTGPLSPFESIEHKPNRSIGFWSTQRRQCKEFRAACFLYSVR